MTPFTAAVFVLFIVLPALLLAVHIGCRLSPVFALRVYALACSALSISLLYHVRVRRQGYKRAEYHGTTIISTSDLAVAISTFKEAIAGNVNEQGYCYIGSEVLHTGRNVEPAEGRGAKPAKRRRDNQARKPGVLPGLPLAATRRPDDADSGQGLDPAPGASGQGGGAGAAGRPAAGQEGMKPSTEALFES